MGQYIDYLCVCVCVCVDEAIFFGGAVGWPFFPDCCVCRPLVRFSGTLFNELDE